jgi:hypothetical protein
MCKTSSVGLEIRPYQYQPNFCLLTCIITTLPGQIDSQTVDFDWSNLNAVFLHPVRAHFVITRSLL